MFKDTSIIPSKKNKISSNISFSTFPGSNIQKKYKFSSNLGEIKEVQQSMTEASQQEQTSPDHDQLPSLGNLKLSNFDSIQLPGMDSLQLPSWEEVKMPTMQGLTNFLSAPDSPVLYTLRKATFYSVIQRVGKI